MANKKRDKEWEVKEMDLQSFMNLMVVLIPMLLLSAEFAKIAVIDIKLPEARGSQTQQQVKDRPKEEEEKLLLTAIVTDSVVTLGAKGGFLPSVFYREFHHYISMTEDHADFEVPYDPINKEPVLNPVTQRPMKDTERYDIFLRVWDEEKQAIVYSYYKDNGKTMLTKTDNTPAKEIAVGDTLYTVTNPRIMEIVRDVNQYQKRPLSVYDQLRNRLMIIKGRFKDAVDAEDIIIAAENEVIYDKIVQIMDAARLAEFVNISIAKLRG